MKFIAALNALNQPWVAILVIIIGMVFDIVCQKYGVSNDAATGVIGAGVGLLTGQAVRTASENNHTLLASVPPPDPIPPAEPARK